jgi:hypothetical protein
MARQWAHLLRIGAGVGADLHHVGDLAGVQPAAEAADLPVTGVGQQHRRPKLPAGQLIQHVQHQLPFGPVVDVTGQVASGAPEGHRVPVPALREEQPPLQRAGGVLGDRVDRHPNWQLAVLPSVPEYCRWTPTECSPSLGKPVSSTTHAVGSSAAVITSASRRRTGRQSHGETATKWCSAW